MSQHVLGFPFCKSTNVWCSLGRGMLKVLGSHEEYSNLEPFRRIFDTFQSPRRAKAGWSFPDHKSGQSSMKDVLSLADKDPKRSEEHINIKSRKQKHRIQDLWRFKYLNFKPYRLSLQRCKSGFTLTSSVLHHPPSFLTEHRVCSLTALQLLASLAAAWWQSFRLGPRTPVLQKYSWLLPLQAAIETIQVHYNDNKGPTYVACPWKKRKIYSTIFLLAIECTALSIDCHITSTITCPVTAASKYMPILLLMKYYFQRNFKLHYTIMTITTTV